MMYETIAFTLLATQTFLVALSLCCSNANLETDCDSVKKINKNDLTTAAKKVAKESLG